MATSLNFQRYDRSIPGGPEFFNKPRTFEGNHKSEQMWHRTAALLFASGGRVTNQQVADACGVSVDSVKHLRQESWFQQTVTKFMEENSVDVQELFKAEVQASLATLIELRDDKKQAGTVRKASATELLDRALGKSVQTVKTDNTTRFADPVAEEERLKEQIANLRAELTLSPPVVIQLESKPEG